MRVQALELRPQLAAISHDILRMHGLACIIQSASNHKAVEIAGRAAKQSRHVRALLTCYPHPARVRQKIFEIQCACAACTAPVSCVIVHPMPMQFAVLSLTAAVTLQWLYLACYFQQQPHEETATRVGEEERQQLTRGRGWR